MPRTALLGCRAELAACQRLGPGVQIVDEGERSGAAHHHRLVGAQPLGGSVLGHDPPSPPTTVHNVSGAPSTKCRAHGADSVENRTASLEPVPSEEIGEDVHIEHSRRLDRYSGLSPMGSSESSALDEGHGYRYEHEHRPRPRRDRQDGQTGGSAAASAWHARQSRLPVGRHPVRLV